MLLLPILTRRSARLHCSVGILCNNRLTEHRDTGMHDYPHGRIVLGS